MEAPTRPPEHSSEQKIDLELLIARAKPHDTMLAMPWHGYRPRRWPRYFIVGPYVVEEDCFGYTFISGRHTLEELAADLAKPATRWLPRPMVRRILSDKPIPASMRTNGRGGVQTYDEMLAGFERSFVFQALVEELPDPPEARS